MEKLTKKNVYSAIVNFATEGKFTFDTEEGEVREVSLDELGAFAQHEIDLLNKKAEKAKNYPRKKKEVEDALMDKVAAVLTDEYQTLADIALQIEDEEATTSKISARLTKLIKAGVAEKTDVKVEGSDGKKKTVKGYKTLVLDVTAEEE